MSIEVKCPACGKTYAVKDEFAGKTAKCSQCGGRMPIPGPAGAPPVAAPPAAPMPPPPATYPGAGSVPPAPGAPPYVPPQPGYPAAPQVYPGAPPGQPGTYPGYPGGAPGYAPAASGPKGAQIVRIIAGALIIVVAVLDLGGFIGHSLKGGAKEAAGSFGRAVEQGARGVSGVGSPELRKESTKMQASGSMESLFGVLLLGLAGVGIAAGVLLFLGKGALFVMIVGAIQALTDLVSVIAFGGGATKLILNVTAIAVGAFVVFAGFTYAQFGKAARRAPAWPT